MSAILFVTRNCLAQTKLAVKSALAQGVSPTVLVIDNCSTDGTRDWLKTKPVATVFNIQQKSLAACWNAGLRAFWASGEESVLCCNNDIVLRSDTLWLLKGQGSSFISGVAVDSLDKLGTSGDRDLVYVKSHTNSHPSFSCFLIRKSVTDRVGWFDESYYPAYFEDNDFHVRMHRAGITAQSTDLPFYHAISQTLNNAHPAEQASIKRAYSVNKEKFRLKYGCYTQSLEYEALFQRG